VAKLPLAAGADRNTRRAVVTFCKRFLVPENGPEIALSLGQSKTQRAHHPAMM
jgi:hypothetical protein